MSRIAALAGVIFALAFRAADAPPVNPAAASQAVGAGASQWTRRPAFPLAPGVAGIIAGVHQGVLIGAGGANFPDQMPWNGGKKAYYDDTFVLAPGDTAWRAAGRLPDRRAYAAVVAVPEGVLAIGGETADAVLSDVVLLKWDGKAVVVERWPSLPAARTSPVAAVLDGRVFVAGGYAPGAVRTSSADFWCLDLARRADGWKALLPWPGPTRAQAVMAALDGAIYLISGLEMTVGTDGKAVPRYLCDAYRYRGGAWGQLPDPPWSAIAAPSPAPATTKPARIYVLGGVDSRLVGKVPRDTRVPDHIMCFDVAAGAWLATPERWPDPIVTAPAAPFGDEWWFVSGEIMAGVRTTSVWSWKPGAAR